MSSIKDEMENLFPENWRNASVTITREQMAQIVAKCLQREVLRGILAMGPEIEEPLKQFLSSFAADICAEMFKDKEQLKDLKKREQNSESEA